LIRYAAKLAEITSIKEKVFFICASVPNYVYNIAQSLGFVNQKL